MFTCSLLTLMDFTYILLNNCQCLLFIIVYKSWTCPKFMSGRLIPVFRRFHVDRRTAVSSRSFYFGFIWFFLFWSDGFIWISQWKNPICYGQAQFRSGQGKPNIGSFPPMLSDLLPNSYMCPWIYRFHGRRAAQINVRWFPGWERGLETYSKNSNKKKEYSIIPLWKSFTDICYKIWLSESPLAPETNCWCMTHEEHS